MKLKTIELKKFKRFTHLTVKDIPETAKLIVLIGPNGCGKTSLFKHSNNGVADMVGLITTMTYHMSLKMSQIFKAFGKRT